MTTPTLSIVIPVYNEEATLATLFARLYPALDALNESYEVVFINDGSRDRSAAILRQQFEARPDVTRVILFGANAGQHMAIMAGFEHCSGEIVVTLDADLQNPPEEIHRLLARLDEGYDVVYGSPQAETHGFLRDQASRITKLALQGAMGVDSASKVSAFRVFRARLREAFSAYRSPSVNIDVLLTWGTTRFGSVLVRQDERAVGDSGYTLRKLINHAINMMTGFSVLPLQVASVLGLAFGSMGFLVLLYVLLRYLVQGSAVPGFPFLASIIAIFSGVQLFALGIFGEYLARMHFRSMERPPYALRSSTAAQGDTETVHDQCC